MPLPKLPRMLRRGWNQFAQFWVTRGLQRGRNQFAQFWATRGLQRDTPPRYKTCPAQACVCVTSRGHPKFGLPPPAHRSCLECEVSASSQRAREDEFCICFSMNFNKQDTPFCCIPACEGGRIPTRFISSALACCPTALHPY